MRSFKPGPDGIAACKNAVRFVFCCLVPAAFLATAQMEESRAADVPGMPESPSRSHAEITIMPLGDSITAGGGINPDGSRSSGYRLALFTNLVSRGASIRMVGIYNPSRRGEDGYCPYLYSRDENHNNGYPGYTSGDILFNLAGEKKAMYVSITNQGGYWLTGGGPTGRAPVYPDVVLFMAGINDLGKRIPIGSPKSAGTVEGNVAEILSWFETNRPNTRVFVGTLLPTAHLATNAKVNEYNAWLASYVTNFANCQLADTHAVFMSDGSLKQSYLLPDGTHPSIEGYTALGNAWAEFLKPVVLQEAKKQASASKNSKL